MYSLVCLLMIFSNLTSAAELKPTRYIGWIDLEEKNQRLAAVADVFVESSENYKEFPRIVASIRISLGGYNTHEYLTEKFHDLKYDYDTGNLTFLEEENSLALFTKLQSKGGRTLIAGSAIFRTSGLKGTVQLLEESDEPGDDLVASSAISAPRPFSESESLPFVDLFEGQYEGSCNGKRAAFQIQTVRKNNANSAASTGLEKAYEIGARLIFQESTICGPLEENQWCNRQNYHSGTYDFSTGKISFQSKQGAEFCLKNGTKLNCTFSIIDSSVPCTFEKKSMESKLRFFPRMFHLNPSKEQREPLPEPAPPENSNLSKALSGSYQGYLHNELNDTYLPVQFDINAYSSTDNPHNPNQMSIATTASFFLGGAFNGNAIVQQLSSRSFYLRPGFLLSGPSSDFIFQINTWRTGFISGVWHSKAFGKVGSFQLIKGVPAELPKAAKTVSNFDGEFIGSTKNTKQKIRFLFPRENASSSGNVLPLTGSYQSVVGNSPIRSIEGGTFDLITQRIGWWIKQDDSFAFGVGSFQTSDQLDVFWPSLPIFGTIVPSFEARTFLRKSELNHAQ